MTDDEARALAHRRLEAMRLLPTGCIYARPRGVEVWPTLLSAENPETLEAVIELERLYGGANAAGNIRAARLELEADNG